MLRHGKSGRPRMAFILDSIDPVQAGFDMRLLDRLCRVIDGHIAEKRHPGAQIALARNGQLALFRSFGQARLEPSPVPASDETLWLLYSNTKVVTAAAMWVLVEEGALT